ncbi:MAG: hypothetical protein MUE84_14600 [Hyphomonas sp.]|nr:hypothetical protein [Hyphomonas sp.]
MFEWLTGRHQDRSKAENLYGAVVTLARTPGFYSDFAVPDTPEGRFEMVTLALFLTLERLKSFPDQEKLVQGTIETFVTDMDDCLREMGVGDMGVSKRVKRAAAAFYERAGSYRPGLADPGPSALTDALTRHVYSGQAVPEAAALAALARRLWHKLGTADAAQLASGAALAPLSALVVTSV